MTNLVWSKPAREDLENIFNYYKLDSTDYSEKLILFLFSKAENLVLFPNLGIKYKNSRLLICKNYIIVYEINKNTINIKSVVNSKMDFN
jgi:addiction module RelE/StbE family toxin